MYFSVTQIPLVLLNLAVAVKCLGDNEIKIFIFKMLPELVNSNCFNCRVSPENIKYQLPKFSEEYFTKEPSVRNILNEQLIRLIKRERSRKFDEKAQLNHDQLAQKFLMHEKYMRESKSHKLKEYLQKLRSERLHCLRILRGKPWNKLTNGNLQPHPEIEYFRNYLSNFKANKQKQKLKNLRHGKIKVKTPMMKGFLRETRRRAYKTINNKNSKDEEGSNKTEKDEIQNIYPDIEAKEPDGFFEKVKEGFINLIERFVGHDYVAKHVRLKKRK